MELNNESICLLSGLEMFTNKGISTGFSIQDFWKFQYSNLWDMQEYIPEFLVAKALGLKTPQNCNGWTLWDILYRNVKIEIKSTAYYHSWKTDGKISNRRTFGITKAYSRYKDSTSEYKRQNDIYIFCLNIGYTKEDSNPMHLENWQFYIIPTKTINDICKDNKTISLGQVQKITGSRLGLSYVELKNEIDKIIDNVL
jgi:hypothetical protein